MNNEQRMKNLYWFKGKNELADYLASNTIAEAESYAKGTAWTFLI